MKKFSVFLLLFTLVHLPLPLYSLDVQRVDIKHSDEMKYDGVKHIIEYTGSVHIVAEDMVLRAERVLLTLNEKEDAVIRAEAFGKVYVKKAEFTGTGGYLLYDIEEEKITLKENPEVTAPGRKLKADIILYWLKEKRLLAKGNVSGFFIPQKKKQ